MRADLHPCRRSGKVVSTKAGKVFLLMWPGDLGPLGAAEDVANMREVETSRRIFRHSAAMGRMSLSVSDNLAIRSDSSCLEKQIQYKLLTCKSQNSNCKDKLNAV